MPVNPGSLSIVLSRYQEPTVWCSKLEPISADVHIVDKMQAIGMNKGNEELNYLYYIIHFYEKLNDFTLFTHCEERAWHYKIHLPIQLRIEVLFMNLVRVDANRPYYHNINWPIWGRRASLGGIRTGSFSYINPTPEIVDQEMVCNSRSVPIARFEEFIRLI